MNKLYEGNEKTLLTQTLPRKMLNCFAKSKIFLPAAGYKPCLAQEIIAKLLYDNNFNAVKDNQVKLYSDEKIKPVPVPSRSVPYHLKAWVADSLENLIKIEEHPLDELVPWVFCEVIVPKDDIYIYIYIYIHILYILHYIYIYIYISKDSYLSYYQTLS